MWFCLFFFLELFFFEREYVLERIVNVSEYFSCKYQLYIHFNKIFVFPFIQWKYLSACNMPGTIVGAAGLPW